MKPGYAPLCRGLLCTVLFLFVGALSVHAQEKVLDFNDIDPGTIVTSVDVDGFMVSIDGNNPKCVGDPDAAVIFDSANPTGGDFDLGTPNETFGGPGIGEGGEAGQPYENDTALEHLLIVHQSCADLEDLDGDGKVDDPDDEVRPTSIVVVFEAPVEFCSYTVVDNEATEDEFDEFFDEFDVLIGSELVPHTGDNGKVVIDVNGGACYQGVKKVVFNRDSSPTNSRGLDDFVFKVPQDGCTYTQGGYKNVKNHADRWAVDYNAPFPYNPSQSWLEVLNTPPKGDPWYILAHQYIAAKNNVLNGASEADIPGKIAEAEALLAAYTPGNVPKDEKDDYTSVAGTLDDFNNGVIGPGHCDDVASKGNISADETPRGFKLHAAYPNPFNPQATIDFTLPEAAHVRLAVYDMLGREVALLTDGALGEGTHHVTFEAHSLPSGTYIYRLDTPDGSLIKSVVLMK